MTVLNTHDIGLNLPMNTKYLSGNPVSRRLIRQFVKTVISMLSLRDTAMENILDVGCGEGIIPRQLRLLWPSANFHGLDINPELLLVARTLVSDMQCISGSVYALPWREGAYDLVCCTEVLEHLKNPELAISEIMRVGKKYFLFSVPNEPWWRIANIARGAYLPEWGNPPGHLNHWTRVQFIRLLSRFFEVVDVQCPFPWVIALCIKN